MSSFYSTGTVSIDNNGTAVTGSGTAWVTAGVRSGDYLFVVEATGPVPYLITSVESATALTLESKTPYEGTGGSGKSYVIARRWDEEKAADTYRLVNEYVAALNDGTFVASAINDATAKTTPVDADLAALADSAASYALKKLTFANLWAWIAAKLKGLALGSATEPSIAFTGDANTGIYSPGADQVAITTGGTARLTVSTAAVTSTLPLVSPLGAAGTPSHTFAGDLNTGMWSPSADAIAFSTAGSERARFDSAGGLLIGQSSTTTPGVGNTTLGAAIQVSAGSAILRASRSGGESLTLNRNTSDGAVATFLREGVAAGSISVASGATTYNTSSDRRLPWKMGFTDVALDAANDRVMALKPHYFPVVDRVGFIADEFQNIYPHAVTGEPGAVDEDGNPIMQSMQAANDSLVADLVAVVQSLTQRISALEAQLSA